MNPDAVNPAHEPSTTPQSHGAAAAMSADEDAGLLLAFAGGDARAFETLYRKHRPWLYRVILRQVGDEDRAESIFQDVWLTMTRRAMDWTPQSQVATWLYSLARSRIVDGWREAAPANGGAPVAASAWLDGPCDSANTANTANTADIADTADTAGQDRPGLVDTAGGRADPADASASPGARLIRTLGELPPLHREAYLLAVEAGLSPSEVARATGSTIDGAQARIRGARVRLAAALESASRAGR